VIELPAGGDLEGAHAPFLAQEEQPFERISFVLCQPPGDQKDSVVLVQDKARAGGRWCGHSSGQSIGGHPQLVGVDGIEGMAGGRSLLHEMAQELPHRRDVVTGDEEGLPENKCTCQVPSISRGRAQHRHGVYFLTKLPQVGDGCGPVTGPREGGQGDLMPAGQVPEHMVSPHLGAGVEGKGQDLAQV